MYYPKHVLEKLDPENCASWEFWRYPVGDGPYRHVRTVPQTMMEFEADPNYYRGKPRIKHVVLKLFPGGYIPPTMQLTELLSGNVNEVSLRQALRSKKTNPALIAWDPRSVTYTISRGTVVLPLRYPVHGRLKFAGRLPKLHIV